MLINNASDWFDSLVHQKLEMYSRCGEYVLPITWSHKGSCTWHHCKWRHRCFHMSSHRRNHSGLRKVPVGLWCSSHTHGFSVWDPCGSSELLQRGCPYHANQPLSRTRLCPNRVHWFWVKFPYVLPSNRYMPSKREVPWNLCPRFFCLRNTATRHPDIEESGTGGREPRGHAWHAKWHHLYKTSKTGAPHRAIGWAESPSRFMSFHLSPKNGFMLMDAKPIGNSPLNLQASAADPPLGSGTSKRSAYNEKIHCQVVVLQCQAKADTNTRLTSKPNVVKKTLEVPSQNGDVFSIQSWRMKRKDLVSSHSQQFNPPPEYIAWKHPSSALPTIGVPIWPSFVAKKWCPSRAPSWDTKSIFRPDSQSAKKVDMSPTFICTLHLRTTTWESADVDIDSKDPTHKQNIAHSDLFTVQNCTKCHRSQETPQGHEIGSSFPTRVSNGKISFASAPPEKNPPRTSRCLRVEWTDSWPHKHVQYGW